MTTYSRDEMEEILRRAAERSASLGTSNRIAYADLVEAAREAGIDDHLVAEAARTVETERQAVLEQEARAAIVAQEHSLERDEGKRALLRLVTVSLFLAALDAATPGGPWAQVIVLVYAFIVALRWGRTMLLAPGAADAERLVERHRHREARNARKRRAATEAAERARRVDEARRSVEANLAAQQERIRDELAARDRERAARVESQREFERSVERGVTQLMSVLAKRLEAAGANPTPTGDFGDYVRVRRGEAPAAPGVKVRMDAPSEPRRASTESPEGEELPPSRFERETRR